MESPGISPVERKSVEHTLFLPGTEQYKEFYSPDGLLNEYAMMWHLREKFPLHFVVFKQMASHLPHEGNVEQVFSQAGLLSDPNMDPIYLATLVKVGKNRSAYKPPLTAIKNKYVMLTASTKDDAA